MLKRLFGVALSLVAASAVSCALIRDVPPTLQVEVIARNLHIPWALSFAPDGRLFFTEEVEGRLRVLSPQREGFRLQPEPVLALPRPPTALA